MWILFATSIVQHEPVTLPGQFHHVHDGRIRVCYLLCSLAAAVRTTTSRRRCVEFFQPLIPMRSELFTRIPTAYVTSEASVTSREVSPC